MSMAQDIAEIKWMLGRMGDPDKLTQSIDQINNMLRYDIEPKLDRALEGKGGATEATKDVLDPANKLHYIRMAIVRITTGRKIEGIKDLRTATGASLVEAKATAEWIEERMGLIQRSKEAE